MDSDVVRNVFQLSVQLSTLLLCLSHVCLTCTCRQTCDVVLSTFSAASFAMPESSYSQSMLSRCRRTCIQLKSRGPPRFQGASANVSTVPSVVYSQ
ncbi:hypothetical protein DFH09DRAFT_161912 [Mycena vulgaris]|nr:hypothetical protein DFH09DRAFT_161912 [Mycena vulgaris]